MERLALPALVIVSLLHAAYYLHVVQDDSYISFRYATHLIDLRSLTFNGPGFPRAEGYSNLTWVLLLAGAYAVGIPPLFAAKGLGLLSFAAALVGTAFLTDALLARRSGWRLMGAGALGSSAWFASWCVQGLETPLVAALVVWSTVALLRFVYEVDGAAAYRRAWIAGLGFGVLGISRPEAPLFGILAIGLCAITLRKSANWRGILLRLTSGFAGPVLGQLAFRLGYYGRPMANTVYAKVHGDELFQQGASYLFTFLVAKGLFLAMACLLLLCAALLLSATRGDRRRLSGPAFVLALLLGYALFIVSAGGDYMRGFRFCMHVLPLACALGAWSFASVLDVVRPASRDPGRLAAVALAVLVVLNSNLRSEREFRLAPQGALSEASVGLGFFALRSFPEGAHFAVGRWLKEYLPHRVLVAVSEAGIVPFESELPVLDYLGLNDRHIADLIHDARDTEVAREVLDQNPAAIVMTGTASGFGPRDEFAGRLPVDIALQRDPRFNGYRLGTVVPFGASGHPPFFAFGVFVRYDIPVPGVRGTLVATPNPVPAGSGLGATTISWRASEGGATRVVVSQDGAAEVVFAEGDRGSGAAPWIQAGHAYEFRLYHQDRRLASVRVIRERLRTP